MDKKLISSAKAAKIAGVTKETIINWCKHKDYRVGNFGIGFQRGRIWLIDRKKLNLVIYGKIEELKTILEAENDIYENSTDESFKIRLLKGIKKDINKLEILLKEEKSNG